MRQQQAARGLWSSAVLHQANRDAIVAAGAVPLLVDWLRSDQPAVLEQTAGALWSLAAGSQQNRDAIAAFAAFLQH